VLPTNRLLDLYRSPRYRGRLSGEGEKRLKMDRQVALLSITTQESRPRTRGIPQVALAVLPANHLFLMGILSIYLLHYRRCRSKISTPDNEGAAPRRLLAWDSSV
jgi:hypothetical protein